MDHVALKAQPLFLNKANRSSAYGWALELPDSNVLSTTSSNNSHGPTMYTLSIDLLKQLPWSIYVYFIYDGFLTCQKVFIPWTHTSTRRLPNTKIHKTSQTFKKMPQKCVIKACFQSSRTLILPGGGRGLRSPFYIFHEKSPHFAVHFVQKYTKLNPHKTSGHYAQISPQENDFFNSF